MSSDLDSITADCRDATIASIHRQLDQWYEDTPVARRIVVTGEGFTSGSFFALWHNLYLAALYRPSPLCPHMTRTRLQTLRGASTRAIDLFRDLHRDKRLPANHIHLQQIFVSCISLLFCLCRYDGAQTLSPFNVRPPLKLTLCRAGDPSNVLSPSWRHSAIERLESCNDLLNDFSAGWPATQKCVTHTKSDPRLLFWTLIVNSTARQVLIHIFEPGLRPSRPVSHPSPSFWTLRGTPDALRARAEHFKLGEII